MKHFKRARPIWISSRVPAAIDCPNCSAVRTARFVESPTDLIYKYACKTCGAVVLQSLDELNEPDDDQRSLAS